MSSCCLVKKEKEIMDDPVLMRAQDTFHLIARETGHLPLPLWRQRRATIRVRMPVLFTEVSRGA